MKLRVTILFFFLYLTLSSQTTNPDKTIFGHVITNKPSNYHFKILLLSNSDSVIKYTYTDSNQNYILIIPFKEVKGIKIHLIAEEVVDSKIPAHVKSSYCGYSLPLANYLSNKITLQPEYFDTANIKRQDFSPILIQREMRFPCIEFKEESLEMLSGCYFSNPDSTIKCIAETLTEYPNYVIEIASHADLKEKDFDNMSIYRGEMIKNILISLGIDSRRLFVKSYGSQRPIITEKGIERLKQAEEKNKARQRNRRVVFSVIRKDFKGQ